MSWRALLLVPFFALAGVVAGHADTLLLSDDFEGYVEPCLSNVPFSLSPRCTNPSNSFNWIGSGYKRYQEPSGELSWDGPSLRLSPLGAVPPGQQGILVQGAGQGCRAWDSGCTAYYTGQVIRGDLRRDLAPADPVAEPYRTLRFRIQFLHFDGESNGGTDTNGSPVAVHHEAVYVGLHENQSVRQGGLMALGGGVWSAANESGSTPIPLRFRGEPAAFEKERWYRVHA